MKHRILSLFAIVALAAAVSRTSAQDHGHLNAGAVGTNQNDLLAFEHAEIFETGGGYVKTLNYAASGTYAGYYVGNITLTAIAATPAHLGPFTNSPAPGSWLFAQLVSVDGPPGGAFAFWDTGATNPTITLASCAIGTNVWRISENDGSPGSDPYGHIHGRRFTATQPGIYVVGFRALDFSTNGAGGGPIHTPSSVLKIFFQAGDNIRSLAREGNQFRVSFGARAGFAWRLLAAPTLDDSDWQPVGTPVIGDDYFHEVLDDGTVEAHRFYRVEGTPVEP